jgi:hypothetical protein
MVPAVTTHQTVMAALAVEDTGLVTAAACRPCWIARRPRRLPNAEVLGLKAFRAGAVLCSLETWTTCYCQRPPEDVLGADHARGALVGHLDDLVVDDVCVAPMSRAK